MSDTQPAEIIYPPLDIKSIVDKTAEHVAKSGERFQGLLREKYEGNAKFSFLYPKDPYNAYYQHMVAKFKSGEAIDQQPSQNEAEETEPSEQEPVAEAPEQPDPIQFASPMPAISAQDLDVLRLTAQFVARNGRQFMTTLAQREANSYQFDFLNPNHTLFGFFRKLVDQYTLVFFPPENLQQRVKLDTEDKYQILDRVNRRMRWEAYEAEEKKRREEIADKEKEEFLAIDWHDFVVVGTVEFVEEDAFVDLPEPMLLQDLKNMSLEDKHRTQQQDDAGRSTAESAATEAHRNVSQAEEDEDDDNDVEMDMEDEDEVDEEIEADAKPTAPAVDVSKMKIRKDYVPNLRRGPQSRQVTLQCQLCKLEIPASEFDEHIRVELIDPKWKEQKLAYERKIRDSNLVQEGMDVAKYLRQMARNRSDIFGQEGVQNSIDEEQALAESKKPVMWDGFSSTAGHAVRRARENVAVDHQLAEIHRTKAQIGPQASRPQHDTKRRRTNQ
ncbi:SF3a splicing factor complex subunit [Linderina macrospora]|uniref:SF3a splicing factor complex subunit n=1 Tax=Linderina macrospora TaxID=4868 RepID=A0ACC1J7R6_9FUNG|nr:SF3a splicing factor complex subunit [Linderina macrospora]